MGYDNYNQGEVSIYDINHNLLVKENSFNGKIKTCLQTNKYYFIKVSFKGSLIHQLVFINNKQTKYYFVMYTIILCNRVVTFLLTDSNYANLPISKGKVILWQKQ